MTTIETVETIRFPFLKESTQGADRSKEPILKVLKEHIKHPNPAEPHPAYRCLEISSGWGHHIAHFAAQFPWVTFQPSEYDTSCLEIIKSTITKSDLQNVEEPIYINAADSYEKWGNDLIGESSLDYVININLVHCSPFKCTEGLFKGVSSVLKPGGTFFTYGPYAFNGKITPESNVSFNNWLKEVNPEWGLRDVNVLEDLASQNGLQLTKIIDMPANNKILIWKKVNSRHQ